jgi:hypothetical protein
MASSSVETPNQPLEEETQSAQVERANQPLGVERANLPLQVERLSLPLPVEPAESVNTLPRPLFSSIPVGHERILPLPIPLLTPIERVPSAQASFGQIPPIDPHTAASPLVETLREKLELQIQESRGKPRSVAYTVFGDKFSEAAQLNDEEKEFVKTRISSLPQYGYAVRNYSGDPHIVQGTARGSYHKKAMASEIMKFFK